MANTEYATHQDLASFWRPLTTDEVSRADRILHYAGVYLRQVASNNGVDIDAKISDDTTGSLGDAVQLVILSATKRAMLNPTDAPPADSWSMSASPYSETMKFTNPSNDIFFKTNELQLLGLSSVGGRSKVGILRGLR